MRVKFHFILALSCFGIVAPLVAAGHQSNRGDSSGDGDRIRTRDQLLDAVNVWMKKHHQPTWTINELIGRSFDQAYVIYFTDNDAPLAQSVESFLVSLIRGQPFAQEVRLRSNRRDEITLQTAEGEINRQRLEWEQVRKNQRDWSDVHTKEVDAPRRVSLPPHEALSVDIFSKAAKRQGKISSGDLHRSPIFLASALLERKTSSHKAGESKRYSSTSAAKPQQLLDGINWWRRAHHQPQIGLDTLTARVADEIFNLREAKDDFWEIDSELLLESLARNAPFIYPASILIDGPATPGEPTSFEMQSINERLPLPLRSTVSLEISSLPDDLKTEEPSPRIDFRRIIMSYAFPLNPNTRKRPGAGR